MTRKKGLAPGRCCSRTHLLNLYAFIVSTILLCLTPESEQLKFSAVQIPSLVERGSNFWLSCQYQLGAASGRDEPTTARPDQLYSVKWYKNNEEFYRLIFSPAPRDSDPTQSQQRQQQQQQQFKQQYFGQSGLNVMMGSSNATHVRLLNASLESEGVYACEISTQNLSTIRYEREIRVYVLPNSRLNIIGFKNHYSLGDTISLVCASDFSRPRPALAWFINNQRITVEDRLFELESQSKSKLNDPTLARITLGLKFRLSHELVSALQQLAPLSGSRQTIRATSIQQQQPIELQCRYKLTEISDVTYNELSRIRSRPSLPPSGREVLAVHKRADQQVVQSYSPATTRNLWQSLFSGQRTATQDTCELGALALQPDDPLIAEPDAASARDPEPPGEDPDENQAERRRRSARFGELMRANCSTISAIQSLRQIDQSPTSFCSDTSKRRRLAISGHSAVGNEQGGPSLVSPHLTSNNNRMKAAARAKESSSSRGHHSLAYLSLHEKSKDASVAYNQTITSADSADFVARLRNSAKFNAGRSAAGSSLLAPPLLEWFINNQEATQASASYSPELPLVRQDGLQTRNKNEVDMDAVETADAPNPSATIDYAEYFANFDNRPAQQYLMLRLRIDKNHFMTPDSSLRLRCSSTQAQVLAIDAASATILPASSSHGPQQFLQAWQKQRPNSPKLDRNAAGDSLAHSRSGSAEPMALNLCILLIVQTFMVFALV